MIPLEPIGFTEASDSQVIGINVGPKKVSRIATLLHMFVEALMNPIENETRSRIMAILQLPQNGRDSH